MRRVLLLAAWIFLAGANGPALAEGPAPDRETVKEALRRFEKEMKDDEPAVRAVALRELSEVDHKDVAKRLTSASSRRWTTRTWPSGS